MWGLGSGEAGVLGRRTGGEAVHEFFIRDNDGRSPGDTAHTITRALLARNPPPPTQCGNTGAVHVANDVGSISILGGATLSHNRAARGKGGAISVGGQVTGDVRVAGGSSAEHNEAGAGAGAHTRAGRGGKCRGCGVPR